MDGGERGTTMRLTWVVAGAVIAVALAGCGGRGGDNVTEGSTRSPASPAVTLRDYAGIRATELVEAYAASPGAAATALLVEPPASSYRPTLEDDLASGNEVPDVALVPAASLATARNSGAFSSIEPLAVDPGALCVRTDLLAAAGIAADGPEVEALLAQNGGGWEQFFAVGERYRETTGAAWFGDDQLMWQAMSGGLHQGLTVPSRHPAVADDGDARVLWMLLANAVANGLGAGETAWDWSGGAALADSSFAVTPCTPAVRATMGERLASSGRGAARWDVADWAPGRGWSLADTYVAVRADASNADGAAHLAAWLTGADGQAAIARLGVGLPVRESAREAWRGPVDGWDAPESAAAIDVVAAGRLVPREAGARDAMLETSVVPALLGEVRRGELTPEESWDALVAAVDG